MIGVVREALETLANDATAADTSDSAQGIDTVNEIEREALSALAGIEQALDSIIVRCEEGDPRTDWLPTIARLAREARGAANSHGSTSE